MVGWQILLEVVLLVLLSAMLFHALRLERALGIVRRDRAELEGLLAAFNDSTHQAENGIERLRSAADGAGRHIARQIESASALKEDLLALIDRGERLADRMDALIRQTREPELTRQRSYAPAPEEPGGPRVRSQAERDLLKALRVAR